MKHIKLYEDYRDEDIEGLIDDLSKVGASESPLKVKYRSSPDKIHRVDPKLLHPIIEKMGEILEMSPEKIENAKGKGEMKKILEEISKCLSGWTLYGSPIDIVE